MDQLQTVERPPKKRCIVYIDGFNCYYGFFRHKPEWKWFNFQSFFETIFRHDDVVFIRYFTASLESKLHFVGACERQMLYINALRTLSKVRIIFGKFQPRNVGCGGSCKERYNTPEEKKTDVNIAVNLIDDAIKQKPDRMVVVSGDSDLEPAVKWIRENYPDIDLLVYIPCLPEEENIRRNDFYTGIKVQCKFLPLSEIPKHVLPEFVERKDGSKVQRPKSWTISN